MMKKTKEFGLVMLAAICLIGCENNVKTFEEVKKPAVYEYKFEKDTLIINFLEDNSTQIIRASQNNRPKWVNDYLDYLYTKVEYNLGFIDTYFGYIDNDTIPELIVDSRCEATGIAVLSWHNDSVSIMYTWRDYLEYIPYSGLCGYYNGNFGHYYTHIYELSEDGFNKIFDHDVEEMEHKESLEYKGKKMDPNLSDSILNEIYYSKGTPIGTHSLSECNLQSAIFEVHRIGIDE